MKEFKLLRVDQDPYHFNSDEIRLLKHTLRFFKTNADPYIADLENATTAFLSSKIARDNTHLPTPAQLKQRLMSISTRAKRLAKEMESLEPYIEYPSLTRAIMLFFKDDANKYLDNTIENLHGISNAIHKYTHLKPGDYSKLHGCELDHVMEQMIQTTKAHPKPGPISSTEFWCFIIEQEIARITPIPGPPVKTIEEEYIRNIGRLYRQHFNKPPSPTAGSRFCSHIEVVFASLNERGHKLPANPSRLIKHAFADPFFLT